MYRIQAYNMSTKHFNIQWCKTMEERKAIIDGLIATGNYSPAGITFEWLARM